MSEPTESIVVTCPLCGATFDFFALPDNPPLEGKTVVECPCCNIESEIDLREFRA